MVQPYKKPARRGRPPSALRTFDDRTMIRMFKEEHAAWKRGAEVLSKKLGVKVSVGAYIRIAVNATTKKLGVVVPE